MRLSVYFVSIAIALIVVSCQSTADDSGISEQDLRILEDRLRSFGFEEPSKVGQLIIDLRQAATEGNKSVLVNAIHYPLIMPRTVSVPAYFTPAEVMRDYDTVFSVRVLNVLRTANYGSLFVNYQGAMLGDGEVWLQQFGAQVKIKAINP